MSDKLTKFLSQKPLHAIAIFHIISRAAAFAIHPNVTIFNDTEGYIQLASLMLDFNISGYEGYRSPGYPLLLVLCGNALPVVVALQMILGVFTSFYMYRILRFLDFNKAAAVYVILFFNCLFHVIFYEFAILTETFTLFVVTICFYYILTLFSKAPLIWRDVLGISLLFGFLILVKPFYIFVPFIVYFLYSIKDFKIKPVNKMAFTLVFPLISFLGWSYVNKINTGYFTSTTFSGLNISQNCVSFAENTTPEYAEIGRIYAKYRDQNLAAGNNYTAMSIWAAQDELSAFTGLSGPDLFHELGNYGKATIKKNPLPYARQVFISWRDFWRTSIYYNYEDFRTPFLARATDSLWLLQNKALLLFKLIFLLLVPYHIVMYFKKRSVTPLLIISIVIVCTSLLQAAFTYGNNSRFSYPFEFLMIVTVLITFRRRLRILFTNEHLYSK